MQELIKEYYELKDGTKVPKIGFGCYNPRKQDYVTIIKTAIDAGYRYFDTASLYETERDLAKALKESGIDRKEVQIASKAWSDEKPEVDQLELHIGYSQELACAYCQQKDILVQAWGPLGRGRMNDNRIIQKMAAKYGKTFSQIAMRFLLQKGIMPIPKASTMEHMLDNANVFDFELSREDMWMLSCMPQETWQGEHPDFAIPKKASNPQQ